MTKPLGHKAYGSIPHMPGSKRGPGDHGLEERQAAFITGVHARDFRVFVQEKWDGCCMAVAKVDGRIVALGRAGHLADSAPFEHMRAFTSWVREREHRFRRLLVDGERVVGEWMLMAHGLRYDIYDPDALFLAFDLMREHARENVEAVADRCDRVRLVRMPHVLVDREAGGVATHEVAMDEVRRARPPVEPADGTAGEGFVFRVERKEAGRWGHRFLAKWVRHDFEAGAYLPGDAGVPTWNRLVYAEAA